MSSHGDRGAGSSSGAAGSGTGSGQGESGSAQSHGSVGHANGVISSAGFTKPKRRLSSLTHAARPTSVASPPASPVTHGQFFPRDLHSYVRPSPPKLQMDDKVMGHIVQNQPMVYTPTGIGGSKEREMEKQWERGMNGLGPVVRDESPRLFGIELKWISLITLALQNAFLTIIMHYSRIKALPSQTYSAAAAVLMNELLKGCVSGFIALRRIDRELAAATQHRPLSHPTASTPSMPILRMFHHTRLHHLSLSLFSPDCWKLSIPAILYVIQNNLQYLAASNLDVATFQVTYQMKILTTAFFSVVMLKKRLSYGKWLALLLLAVGVGIVQLQSTASTAHAVRAAAPRHTNSLRSIIPGEEDETEALLPVTLEPERVMHPLTGFIAVCLACMTSGLAGVYFELILKGNSTPAPAPSTPAPQADLWVRNTQLSIFSLIPALIPIIFGDHGGTGFGRLIAPFKNFNGWALGTVLTQTVGGLVTAVVIRYSDNIMKGFATSLSILISFLASVILFNYPITFGFLLGASVVLLATYLYNAPSPPARSSVAVAPGSPITSSAPILGEPQKPSRTSSMISLLGLGSTSSRRPSAADLRSGAATPYSSSSTPGTPYLGPIPSSEGLSISTHGRRSKAVPNADSKEKKDKKEKRDD